VYQSVKQAEQQNNRKIFVRFVYLLYHQQIGMSAKPNITQTIPFFGVADMAASLHFYVDGLGFNVINQWVPRDKIEWCCLQRGAGTLMLQEPHGDAPKAKLARSTVGHGVSICFICEDALVLYHEFTGKGLTVREPFVGNNMWVVTVSDPDGYILEFESPTDVPEETRYSEWKQ
jgi:catechol 2,3-dioxygenase-like lactoylglutathione lyase family enzyme